MGIGWLERDHRISQDYEIRPRARVEMGGGGGGQVSARRESPDPDAVRLDAQISRVLADIANRAMGIVEWSWMVIARAESILEDEAGEAVLIQPRSDIAALFVHGQMRVATAGTDHHASASGFVSRRQIDSESGAVLFLLSEGAGSAVRPQQLGPLRHGWDDQSQKQNQVRRVHGVSFSGQTGWLASTIHQATAPRQ